MIIKGRGGESFIGSNQPANQHRKTVCVEQKKKPKSPQVPKTAPHDKRFGGGKYLIEKCKKPITLKGSQDTKKEYRQITLQNQARASGFVGGSRGRRPKEK